MTVGLASLGGRVHSPALSTLKKIPDIRAVTFDAGGTLIAPRVSVGHVYAEVAARHGVNNLSPDRLNQRFGDVWKAKADFDYSQEAWFGLVRKTFAEKADHLPVPFFHDVYQQFAHPEVWTVFADVLPAFDWLASRDIRLAVISNWDERLHAILAGLKLRKYLEIVLVSREVGFNKPSSVIYEEALRKLGLPPESVLHVGDSRAEDLEGARGAGLHGLELVRSGRPTRDDQIGALSDLSGRLAP